MAENFGSLHSQIPGFGAKPRAASGPPISRSCLGQLNFIRSGKIRINSKVPSVHAAGAAKDRQAKDN